MRTSVLLITLLWLPTVSANTHSRVPGPSFYVDACAWEATHILVVTEGDKIDGVVTVLESWKGDLHKGDQIMVPELAAFASEKSRRIAMALFGEDPKPASVTGARMVLFLIRQQGKDAAGKPGPVTWLPADKWFNLFDDSIAWIENDKVFALAQIINPGPSQIRERGMHERDLKRQVGMVLTTQTALENVLRQGDPAKITAALPSLLRTESMYAQDSVLRTLGNAGPKALPALRALLKDESFLGLHCLAIEAMAKAGGVEVGPELVEVLKQELAYWQKVGPGLEADWWYGKAAHLGERNRLRSHVDRVYAAVWNLEKLRFADCRETVTATRTLWRSLPQLKDIGSDQIGRACDSALAALDNPR